MATTNVAFLFLNWQNNEIVTDIEGKFSSVDIKVHLMLQILQSITSVFRKCNDFKQHFISVKPQDKWDSLVNFSFISENLSEMSKNYFIVFSLVAFI